MNNQEIVVLTSSTICLVLAWRLLTRPTRPVQWARWFTVGTATGSIAATLTGWLLARPWALATLGRGALVVVLAGACLGVLLLLRARLWPRGLQPTSRRYTRYANYKRVTK